MSTLLTSRNAIALTEPTLATVLERVLADQALDSRQKQDAASALRTVAKALGHSLDQLPAHPGRLRGLLKGFTPAMADLSERRWRNALSLLRRALTCAGISQVAARSREPFAPEWTAMLRPLRGTHAFIALCRLARYCSIRGITPADLNDQVFTAFGQDLETGALIQSPHTVHRKSAIAWNRLVATIKTGSVQPVTVPSYSRTYARPWSVFPPSLKVDVEAYLDRLAGKDILAELDFKPLRPASLKTRQYQIRAYLSALVDRKRDPQTLCRLADVVAVAVVKDGLRFFIDRSSEKSSQRVHDIAGVIRSVAQHWVKVDPEHLAALRTICKRLKPRHEWLTPKNRNRLRQFDDPVNVRALLTLPRTLMAEVARKIPTRANALIVQTAVAIELLLMSPIRLKNLGHLKLGHDLIRTRGGQLQLAIPNHQVKNNTNIEATLPVETSRLIEFYIERYQPLLTPMPSTWLFPGLNGPKTPALLGSQISSLAKKRCGLAVNAHLFRHLVAKLYLEANPGAYGVVRLLLGHKSVDTTTRFYCGTETAAAAQNHYDHMLVRRGPAAARRLRKQ